MMGSGFGFGIPGFGMVFFWGLVILLVVWAVRGLGNEGSAGEKNARQILDDRFAKGEINQEEYERKKQAMV